MNWDQFKCLLCHPCLPGAVLAILSLTQEIVGLNAIYIFCTNPVDSTELGKTQF